MQGRVVKQCGHWKKSVGNYQGLLTGDLRRSTVPKATCQQPHVITVWGERLTSELTGRLNARAAVRKRERESPAQPDAVLTPRD